MRKGCHLPHGKLQTAALGRDGSAENKNRSLMGGGWGGVEMQAERHVQQTVEETQGCRHTERQGSHRKVRTSGV